MINHLIDPTHRALATTLPLNHDLDFSKNLVAYWPCNDGYGNRVRELIHGYHMDSLVTNLPWKGNQAGAGHDGATPWYDGTTVKIQTPSGMNTDAFKVQSHSFSLWSYWPIVPPGNGCMLICRASAITTNGYEWRIAVSTTWKPSFAFHGTGGVRGFFVDTVGVSSTNAVNQPIMWSGSYDQSVNKVSFYANGNLLSTISTTADTITHAANDPIIFGWQANNTLLYEIGNCWNMMFWDEAKPPGFFAKLYEPVNRYPFQKTFRAHSQPATTTTVIMPLHLFFPPLSSI
jgi:hypothetical protein